jgi:DNA-3-methyladenine glycosylase II
MAETILAKDQIFCKIFETVEILPPLETKDLYISLLSAIVSQQLSTKVAATIWQRFLLLFAEEKPLPNLVLAKTNEELRTVGLSQQKASYLKNIAEYALNTNWKDSKFYQQTDSEIIAELTSIKGVGVWTVEMLLIFAMNRPDVFSVGDLGIKQAMVKLYEIDESSMTVKALQKRMIEISENWKPHRSLACRYLWKWKDTNK